MSSWSVLLRPAEENPSGRSKHNRGGIVVLLADADAEPGFRGEFEVSRVAYARRHSRNPEVPFEEQLQAEIAKAEAAAEAANEMLDEFERAKAEERLKAQDRMREILGPPPTGRPA